MVTAIAPSPRRNDMHPPLDEQISTELRLLEGQPFTECNRGADLIMFSFGEERERLTRTGARIMVSPIHMHLQCRWRVCDGDCVAFGSDDIFYRGSEPMNGGRNGQRDREEFDYLYSLTALDVLHVAWFAKHRRAALMVVSAKGDRFGGFRILLAGGMTVECLPCESRRDAELWRLFGHRADDSHFVVLASGVEPRVDNSR
jgi:hypothetical protein